VVTDGQDKLQTGSKIEPRSGPAQGTSAAGSSGSGTPGSGTSGSKSAATGTPAP
jgi:hypothetical protein